MILSVYWIKGGIIFVTVILRKCLKGGKRCGFGGGL